MTNQQPSQSTAEWEKGKQLPVHPYAMAISMVQMLGMMMQFGVLPTPSTITLADQPKA
jgi:hypothetical protein